ncbi:MAG: riboflavin synthase [Nitrospinae bacterium]|nr:riboflavin synthase [Nitrospinota bacterium]
MFGGFVENLGSLKNISQKGGFTEIEISMTNLCLSGEIIKGRSIAINGVCLTVIAFNKNSFSVECSAETLSKTTFSSLKAGEVLNLELPLKLETFIDGHIVTGHIDTLGTLHSIKDQKDNSELTFTFDRRFAENIVEKGSIAINGISLTAYNVSDDSFTVSVIPHTFQATNLKELKVNSKVNLEFDILGKYILKKANLNDKNSGLSMGKLAEHGFI